MFSKLLDLTGIRQYLLVAVLLTLVVVYWRWNALADDLAAATKANTEYAANEQTLITGKRDAEIRLNQLNVSLIAIRDAKNQAAANATKLQKQLNELKTNGYSNENDRKTIECLDVMAPDGLLAGQ